MANPIIDGVTIGGTTYDLKDPNLTEEVTDLKRAITNLDERTEITAITEKDYYHANNNIKKVTLYGNEYAFGNAKIANKKNIMPSYPLSIQSRNGLTLKWVDRFFILSGTATSGTTFRSNPNWFSIDAPETGTYKIKIYRSGTSSNGTLYFDIRGSIEGGSEYSIRSCYVNNNAENTWTVNIRENTTKLLITCNVENGHVFDGETRIWVGIYQDGFQTLDLGKTIANDGEETFVIENASFSQIIDSIQHESIAEYNENVQDYIDNKAIDINNELVYIRPEAYGAKGDGQTDDTAAMQACIDAAITNGVAVRAYARYLCTYPIVAAADTQNIYIHNLIYTGADVAFVLCGSYNCIRIDRIYAYNSTAAGFRLTTNASHDANYNKIDLGSVYSYTNGIEYYNDLGASSDNRKTMYYNVLHVQNLYSRTANAILFHSTGGQGNENSFWGKHISCANGWLLYCDRNVSDSLRMYEFCMENACAKGIYGSAILINCRTTECMDKKRQSNSDNDIGTIIKFVGKSNTHWYETKIDYDCIDVSLCKTYQELYDYMNQLYQGGLSVALAYDGAFARDPNYTLGDCNRLWDYYARISDGRAPAGKLIAYFNHKGFVPDNPWYHKITVSDYTPLVTDKFVPTEFDIDVAQCTIHLEDSYCCVGIKEFTLIQYADKKAIVYEKNNSETPIFDGTSLEAGTYKFTCTMVPKYMETLNKDGSIASRKYVDNLYFGDNEKWTVEKLNIV